MWVGGGTSGGSGGDILRRQRTGGMLINSGCTLNMGEESRASLEPVGESCCSSRAICTPSWPELPLLRANEAGEVLSMRYAASLLVEGILHCQRLPSGTYLLQKL